MLTHPAASFKAAELGCSAVKSVVVRSLFPMMILSRLISRSRLMTGLCGITAKSRMWRRLRLSDSVLPAVVSGLISGLPVTAVEVESLVREGRLSESEGAKAIALASVPSPAFVILAASPTVAVGILRYVTVLILSYTVAAAFPSQRTLGTVSQAPVTFTEAMSSSVTSAISVSANIIFFTAVSCLLSSVLPRIKVLTAVFFEMGSAIALSNGEPLVTAAVLGWCGLSALSQIRSAAPSVSVKPYAVTRLISCAILVLLQFFADFLQNPL